MNLELSKDQVTTEMKEVEADLDQTVKAHELERDRDMPSQTTMQMIVYSPMIIKSKIWYFIKEDLQILEAHLCLLGQQGYPNKTKNTSSRETV